MNLLMHVFESPSRRECCIPVVLVANFVLPGAESAARVNILVLEVGKNVGEGVITVEVGCRVAVVEAANVGADNLIFGDQKIGFDKTLDAILQESLVVDRLIG